MNPAYRDDEGMKRILETVDKTFSPAEIEKINKAYEFACAAHDGQKRLSGDPYITHPVEVALILAKLGMDADSIAAALLHDTVEDTSVTLQSISEQFGAETAKLVDGVTKLGKIPLATKEEEQAENIRKMLMAMSNEIRVIIIKLADRLHNMRTLKHVAPQKRRDKSLETLEIYAPIAHRLGIRTIKDELEDLAISYLDPVAYGEIEESLAAQSRTRKEFLEDIKAQIRQRVTALIPDATVEGRIKSVHGIYRKMYMQNRDFDEIFDIYAVRIIVNTVNDCYNCLGLIHDLYRPIPGRFKDYIATPKPNRYQSLHTTVIGRAGIPFEVQIRTWDMHKTAEYGVAAHWKYKLGMSGGKIEEGLPWIQQLIDRQNDLENVEDIVRTIKTDLVPEEVYVFTPKGDVKCLPMGSTVIDFAYAIHSQVGNKMTGAKVNSRIVPIDYQVKTGDIVEIITTSQQGKGPSRDWLNIVKTSEARSKIRSWFKKEKRDENIAEGKAEVEREFRRNFIRLPEPALQEFLQKIAERLHFGAVEDFYAAVGYGGISITRLMPRIKDDYTKIVKADNAEVHIAPEKKRTKSSEGVIVEGIDNCLVKFARCCNPLPGDEIIGFITRGHGVSIHKTSCVNVPEPGRVSPESERWINASWDKNVREEFKSTLLVSCLNRVGMLADISGQLAAMHVMIHDINTRHFKDGRSSFLMTITVSGVEHLKSVIAKLEKVSGVLSVERSGG
ncbi:MAG TPA: bifunctional (p)ppGpp synthetase/guanosine-3',5'-bis(diphosphate) 3'-pyrophosphohydrolase [Clostridiales bacterium]|nr:MAG: GTP pyrophosphokinase [Firmicutes bacterium ADurb.Bin262]HQK72940.1 bifunctional (p)ppGpp synthetase/guanosine-3',5'-bis(diphosphate) 3'-pyrophosphohydrolase [Clostridiales bacterium]